MEFDTVIVGSGAAGIAAALELEHSGTAIIDVGNIASSPFHPETLSDAKRSGELEELLGSNWEMLANLDSPKIHSKLRASQMRYVHSGVPFSVTDESKSIVNSGRGSYARGGFANAWGAQVYRYTQSDLDALGDWPVMASELEPYYNRLEAHMGVSGLVDDLSSFFGGAEKLLAPSPIIPSASRLLSLYQRKKDKVNKSGLLLGRPRLAVLTEDYAGYSAYNFGETEFFNTGHNSIYTPQRTLDELISRGKIKYLPRIRLDGYLEKNGHVELLTSNVDSGENVRIKTNRLLLACGALQTARLVMLNNRALDASLSVLEHPPTLLPVIMPSSIASELPVISYPIQLAGCFDHAGEKQMLSIYYAGGMLRSDLLPDLPFSMKENLWLLKNILSGLFVVQIWRPSIPHLKNRLKLDVDNEIRLEYPVSPNNHGIQNLLRSFRKIGLYGHERFAQESPVGWGFHFAGTLPMKETPSEFNTDRLGRLWNCKRVHAIDGSVLPSLPAKNLTLTIMANAARIAASLPK